jgi:hypothetical protein
VSNCIQWRDFRIVARQSLTWSMATWEALVPLFDYIRISVAYDISRDVVVLLQWSVQVNHYSELQVNL